MTPAPHPAPPVRERRRLLAAGLVLLLAVAGALALRLTTGAGGVAALGCTVVADEAGVRPPLAVRDAAAHVEHLDVDGSAVDVACVLEATEPPGGVGAPDPAGDPASWSVVVDARAADVAGVPAVADALLAAVAAWPGGSSAPAWRLEVRDPARSVVAVLSPGAGAGPAVDAVTLRTRPGVAEVWLGPDSARVAVATGPDVAPVLVAAAGLDLPPTTVDARDHWLEVQQVHPGAWPDPTAVALAVDVATWSGVARVVLSGGAPATAALTVETTGDAERAHVAGRLASTVHTGPVVTYAVRAGQVAVDGVLGVAPDARAADPGADASADAGRAALAAGVPACTGADLRVEVLGTDAAAGRRYLSLGASRTGADPCVLQGVPALAFTRASGTRTPDLTQLPDLVAPAQPPPVLLEPGGRVQALVRWGAMSTSLDPDVAVGVTVRPVVGGPATDLPLPDPLDVLAGATVEVGPWLPPGS